MSSLKPLSSPPMLQMGTHILDSPQMNTRVIEQNMQACLQLIYQNPNFYSTFKLKCTFSKVLQKLSITFFWLNPPLFSNSWKPISNCKSRPQHGKIRQKLPCCGLHQYFKIDFLKITQKRSISVKNSNNIKFWYE